MSNFGSHLKQLRSNSNRSRKDVADFVGVSVESVRQWEEGITRPNSSKMYKLASILGVKVKELIYGHDDINPLELDTHDNSTDNYKIDIKELRQHLNLTQEELAEKLGVTRQTVVNYENGAPIPLVRMQVLNKLKRSGNARVKNINIYEIVGENLKKLRGRISHAQLAAYMDLKPVQLISIEQEFLPIPIEVILKIVEYFGVSIDWLFGRTDTKEINISNSDKKVNIEEINPLLFEKDERIKVLEKLVEQQQDIIELYKKLSNSDRS